jgi:hypothetical protein
MADNDSGDLQSHIDRHQDLDHSFVRSIYAENKHGKAKLRYGWNYRFVNCEIDGLEDDEEYNEGHSGENAIHIWGGSLRNTVRFTNSVVTIDGATIECQDKDDPTVGLVASGCRLAFRAVPKDLGEEKPLQFKNKPPKLSSCEIDFTGVMFKEMKKAIMLSGCRANMYGLTMKDCEEGGSIDKSECNIVGGSLKLQKGMLHFTNSHGEISGLSIKVESGQVISFNQSNYGIHGCSGELEKGTFWYFANSAIRMDKCQTQLEKGLALSMNDSGYLRMQESNFRVEDEGTCISLSKAGCRCLFYKGSASVKKGTCVVLDSGPGLIAKEVSGITVDETGTAIKNSGGTVYAQKVGAITVGKMGPACDGSGGATFEFVDCGSIAGVPKSLVGDDVTYIIRGEKTSIGGDISFKGTLISGHADEST